MVDALAKASSIPPATVRRAWMMSGDLGKVAHAAFAGGEAWAPGRSLESAAKPGAILLAANDISSADGLVQGSLQRAMSSQAASGDDFTSK